MAVSKPDRKLWRLGSARYIAASKANRNSSWGLGKSHGKAAGRVLRLLRAAGNVPDGSFEAQ